MGTIDCDVNSNCTDTEGSYTCYCIDGFFDQTGGRAAAGECKGTYDQTSKPHATFVVEGRPFCTGYMRLSVCRDNDISCLHICSLSEL